MVHEQECPKLRSTYTDVALGDGPFKRWLEDAKDVLLGLSDDSLLKGFRSRTGKSTPGQEMGGWYSGDASCLRAYVLAKQCSSVFHASGQYLSGMATLYRITGDERLWSKAIRLIQE